jgi:hypothetical protein
MTSRLNIVIPKPEIQPLYQALVFRGHPLEASLQLYEPTREQLLQVYDCLEADNALFTRAVNSVVFDPVATAIPKLTSDYSETLVAALFRWVYQQETIEDALNTKGLNADKDPKHRRYLVKMVRDFAVRTSNLQAAFGVMLAPPPRLQLLNTYGLNPDAVEDERERKRLARNDNHVLKLLGKRGMQARTVAWRYNLSTEDVFQILGRDSIGRPARD